MFPPLLLLLLPLGNIVGCATTGSSSTSSDDLSPERPSSPSTSSDTHNGLVRFIQQPEVQQALPFIIGPAAVSGITMPIVPRSPRMRVQRRNTPEECVRQETQQGEKFGPGQPVVGDPSFKAPWVSDPQSPRGEISGSFKGPDLNAEADEFWYVYRILADYPDMYGTSTWTPQARKECMDAHKEGRLVGSRLRGSDQELKRWRKNFDLGWLGRPDDGSAGHRAAQDVLKMAEGKELDQWGYQYCFHRGVDFEKRVEKSKSREEKEGRQRGLKNGFMIGDCTANLRKKAYPCYDSILQSNPDGASLQQMGDWFRICVEEAKKQAAKESVPAPAPAQRATWGSRIKSTLGKVFPGFPTTGEEVDQAGKEIMKAWEDRPMPDWRKIPSIKFPKPAGPMPAKVLI
ncbi:MAG: hypothetical protein M1823_001738 [Watsoniomyces obsoletus]|nr:MAG: hypothetical protein M1823_001738 [Watsoniomyces obsoletus]